MRRHVWPATTTSLGPGSSGGETGKRQASDRVQQQEKTPTTSGWGQAPRHYWRPFPRKAPQSKTKQVSWLAAHTYSLRLPKGASLSGLCRFRSAYSCGAALALHHLPCSQRQAVRQLGFVRPINCVCYSLLMSHTLEEYWGTHRWYARGCPPACIYAWSNSMASS
jgi:hypothetical protein